MKNLSVVLLLSTLFFSSVKCDLINPDSPDQDPPVDTSVLKVVWRIPFPADQYYGSTIPAIYGNKVVFSNFPFSGAEKFYAFDANTGNTQHWVWEDYLSPNSVHTSPGLRPVTLDNILCLAPGNGIIGVNMNNGETIWKNKFPTSSKLTKFETCLVAESEEGNKRFVKLVDIKTGDSRTVFSVDTSNTPFADFFISNCARGTNNDTIIYLSDTHLFQDINGAYNIFNTTFYAYNITTKQILWYKKDMPLGAASVLYDDNLVINDDGRIICLNRFTGDKIWETPTYPKSFGFFDIFEDKIVMVDQGSPGYIHAYNKSNGQRAWSIPHGGNTSQPVYHKGLIYFIGLGDLWAIRVSDGKIIWNKVPCPDKKNDLNSYWSFGVNADPVGNKLYLASFTGAFCIEPAE
jgi:outer membrane protein assembly factor BamB